MQQRSGDGARVELKIRDRLGGMHGVRDRRVSTLARLPGVPLGRKRIRFLNKLHAFRR